MTVEEEFREVHEVGVITVLLVICPKKAVDYSIDHSRRVGRVWWNVEIRIIWFLIRPCDGPSFSNCDCEVKEVY